MACVKSLKKVIENVCGTVNPYYDMDRTNILGDVSKIVDNQLIAEIAHMLKVMHDSVITKKIYNIVLYIYNNKSYAQGIKAADSEKRKAVK